MLVNPQETPNLVKFTEEIFNWKIIFRLRVKESKDKPKSILF